MKWLMFLIVLLFVPLASASCNIKASCDPSEVCVLGTHQINNSHASSCDNSTLKVCCSSFSTASIKDSCSSSETQLLTISQLNDSHVAESFYGYKVCATPKVSCSIQQSCEETAILTMNSTNNSHIGSVGYFGNTLCCTIGFSDGSSSGSGGSSGETVYFDPVEESVDSFTEYLYNWQLHVYAIIGLAALGAVYLAVRRYRRKKAYTPKYTSE